MQVLWDLHPVRLVLQASTQLQAQAAAIHAQRGNIQIPQVVLALHALQALTVLLLALLRAQAVARGPLQDHPVLLLALHVKLGTILAVVLLRVQVAQPEIIQTRLEILHVHLVL